MKAPLKRTKAPMMMGLIVAAAVGVGELRTKQYL
jgi:hypothetical protein